MNMNSSSTAASTNHPQVVPAKPSGYYSNSRDELLSLVPASATHILDVGCGEGRLGERLKLTRAPSVIEVVGVEVSETVASLARTRLDKVIVGDVENLALEYVRYFDCITFADVLEHLRNPSRTLSAVSECLRPDGVIVASIPNIQQWRVVLGLLRGSFDYAEEGIMDSTHLRFFTRKSVLELFSATGYDVQFIRAHVPTPRGRLLNTCTAGVFAGFLAFQYHVVARRRFHG